MNRLKKHEILAAAIVEPVGESTLTLYESQDAILDVLMDAAQKEYDFEREGNKIKVIPTSQFSFRTKPIDDKYILLSDNEFVGIAFQFYQFDKTLTKIIPFDFREFVKATKNNK